MHRTIWQVRRIRSYIKGLKPAFRVLASTSPKDIDGLHSKIEEKSPLPYNKGTKG
jgi:hypothetical protein